MFKALANLWVAILCGVGLIFVGLVAIYISLPDVTILRKCIVTEMYHVRLCENDSTFVPFDKISPYIVGAVIMSEDASFYFHAGVDVDEMKESFIKDAEKMRFARGASTITQQLAKNVFLSGEKSPVRKIQEILIAVQLERYFTKKQLLTYYLNVVEFGPGLYGIGPASQYYFGRSASDVTPEQAAFLAFLLPNPKKYNQSFERRELTSFAEHMVRTILHKMLRGRKITAEEHQGAQMRVPQFPWRHDLPPANPEILKKYYSDKKNKNRQDDESNQEGDTFKFDLSPDDAL